MTDHKYILEKYHGMNSRHICPGCNSRNKSFSRYIDIETGEYLSTYVGTCNREDKCGYHFTPRQFFDANGKTGNFQPARNPIKPAKPKQASYVPIEAFKDSLKEIFTHNNFIMALNRLFGGKMTDYLAGRYKIGTSKRWNGATIFWQIDKNGRIRTGKIMLYNPETGKRMKDQDGKAFISWVHTLIGQKEFELKQCFFGEHLLGEDLNKPVAVVESEKTAIIASAYLPKFIWLACGAKTGLNDKCEVLKGRKVILYPDLGGYDDWAIKAKKYGFTISDILDKHATTEQKAEGLDLADFLIMNKLAGKRDDVKTKVNAVQNPIKPNSQPPEILANLSILSQNENLIKPKIQTAGSLTKLNITNDHAAVNQLFMLQNNIINLWDKMEQATVQNNEAEQFELIKKLNWIADENNLTEMVERLGRQYAPKTTKHFLSG